LSGKVLTRRRDIGFISHTHQDEEFIDIWNAARMKSSVKQRFMSTAFFPYFLPITKHTSFAQRVLVSLLFALN